MNPKFHGSKEFERLVAGQTGLDLARIALEIAQDETPGLDLERYLLWIDNLAERVRARCPAGAEPLKILRQIHWAMFVEEGFEGNRDEYYDPRNSYLNEVIERKTGIPISLCILYQCIAQRLGVELFGVNLPAHFMLKLSAPDTELFVDPFHGDFVDRKGCERRLSEILRRPIVLNDDHLSPCPSRLVVARLLRNLKSIHFQAGELPSALLVQARLTAILADDPDEQRDLGVLSIQLGLLDAAVQPLERYLAARKDADDAPLIHSLLRDARREISLRN